MANPTAAILVIGDEILSGRTREGNAHHLAGKLAEKGIDLTEIRVIPDVEATIIAAVRELSARVDHLFTSGGIGPTHDDVTADAIAKAFGARLAVREDARALLAARYDKLGVEFNEARLRMARIPDGAVLIENPVSAAPGFTLKNVHVMAGVPDVFQAMVASLLPRLTGGAALMTRTLMLLRPEGEIAGALGAVAAAFPMLSIGSYPFMAQGKAGTNLVFRGFDAASLDAALARCQSLWPQGE